MWKVQRQIIEGLSFSDLVMAAEINGRKIQKIIIIVETKLTKLCVSDIQ